jgi:hypothetical protein
MRTRRVPVLARLVVVLGVLLTSVSGCRITSGHPQAMRTLVLPSAKTSVLVIITDSGSSRAMRATGALAISSARPGERLLILSAHDGAVLASSQAPPSPGMQVAEPPAVPPAHATSFQKARYAQAVQQYQKTMLADMATLRSQQQEELAAWARSAVAKADAKAILAKRAERQQH